jgi:hypothetical protein
MTALDYFQIHQLAAKYAQYIDTCSNNGYANAKLGPAGLIASISATRRR